MPLTEFVPRRMSVHYQHKEKLWFSTSLNTSTRPLVDNDSIVLQILRKASNENSASVALTQGGNSSTLLSATRFDFDSEPSGGVHTPHRLDHEDRPRARGWLRCIGRGGIEQAK